MPNFVRRTRYIPQHCPVSGVLVHIPRAVSAAGADEVARLSAATGALANRAGTELDQGPQSIPEHLHAGGRRAQVR